MVLIGVCATRSLEADEEGVPEGRGRDIQDTSPTSSIMTASPPDTLATNNSTDLQHQSPGNYTPHPHLPVIFWVWWYGRSASTNDNVLPLH